jgi:hypothetical protein
MKFNEARKHIESHDFAANINVASDFKTFLLATYNQKAVKIVLKDLYSQELRTKIFYRILELSHQQFDKRYENPWDIPLAVYLWLLSNYNDELTKIGANIVTQIPQCWWASKVARYILLKEREYNNADNQKNIFHGQDLFVTQSQTTDSEEVILHVNLMSNFNFYGFYKSSELFKPQDLDLTQELSTPQLHHYMIVDLRTNTKTEKLISINNMAGA